MLLRRTPKKEKRVSLKGAVQINRNSYFVYADEGGKTFLNTGEHIQKYAVKRMMSLNPSIEAPYPNDWNKNCSLLAQMFPSYNHPLFIITIV